MEPSSRQIGVDLYRSVPMMHTADRFFGSHRWPVGSLASRLTTSRKHNLQAVQHILREVSRRYNSNTLFIGDVTSRAGQRGALSGGELDEPKGGDRLRFDSAPADMLLLECIASVPVLQLLAREHRAARPRETAAEVCEVKETLGAEQPESASAVCDTGSDETGDDAQDFEFSYHTMICEWLSKRASELSPTDSASCIHFLGLQNAIDVVAITRTLADNIAIGILEFETIDEPVFLLDTMARLQSQHRLISPLKVGADNNEKSSFAECGDPILNERLYRCLTKRVMQILSEQDNRSAVAAQSDHLPRAKDDTHRSSTKMKGKKTYFLCRALGRLPWVDLGCVRAMLPLLHALLDNNPVFNTLLSVILLLGRKDLEVADPLLAVKLLTSLEEALHARHRISSSSHGDTAVPSSDSSASFHAQMPRRATPTITDGRDSGESSNNVEDATEDPPGPSAASVECDPLTAGIDAMEHEATQTAHGDVLQGLLGFAPAVSAASQGPAHAQAVSSVLHDTEAGRTVLSLVDFSAFSTLIPHLARLLTRATTLPNITTELRAELADRSSRVFTALLDDLCATAVPEDILHRSFSQTGEKYTDDDAEADTKRLIRTLIVITSNIPRSVACTHRVLGDLLFVLGAVIIRLPRTAQEKARTMFQRRIVPVLKNWGVVKGHLFSPKLMGTLILTTARRVEARASGSENVSPAMLERRRSKMARIVAKRLLQ